VYASCQGQELNVSTQLASSVRKKGIEKRDEQFKDVKMWRKRKTTPGLGRKIKATALKNGRAFCKKLSVELTNESILVDRRTVNTVFWSKV